MALEIVDVIYLLFTVVGLYFTFLFLILFFEKRKSLYEIPLLTKWPSVSIVIPAYNEEKSIANTIRTIKKLKYPKKLEMILIDDGSTDKTAEIAKKFKGIRVFKRKNSGKANSLNFGIKKAKGEIVACIDADSYPEQNALLKTMPFFNDKKVGAVTTSVFVKNQKTVIEKLQMIEYIMIAWSRKMLEYLDSIYVTPGPMSLYRKKILLKIGGFDERNMTEDIEIAWRLMSRGYKIKMSLDTDVLTSVPNKFKKWWHQRIRWNIGGVQTMLKYFNLFLNKKFDNIGLFLLPMFSASYILSFIGFVTILYVVFNALFNFFSMLFGSYAIGASIITPIELSLLPNLFIFLCAFVFVLSLVFVAINLKVVGKSIDLPKGIVYLIIFILIYIAIYPFNLIHSTWKLLRKSYKW